MRPIVTLALILSSAALAAASFAASPTPYDREAVISKDLTRTQVYAMAELVRVYGYRCDTVSAASPWLFSRGFNLKCNRFRYSYDLEDRGGRWEVTVK